MSSPQPLPSDHTRLGVAFERRFGERLPAIPELPAGSVDALARQLGHSTQRRYTGQPVSDALLRLLYAAALSSPSKSDLQQADILRVRDPQKRAALAALLPDMPWVGEAPVFLVFLGNNRRIRKVATARGHPFANDHLDAFFNATVDAGIVLSSFILAAETAGLGVCPISALRTHAAEVGNILGLPAWLFPVAGLSVGYPDQPAGRIVPRLPLDLTVHEDRYDELGFLAQIDSYDRRRHALLPYAEQEEPERFGTAGFYGWSEAKARQYATPARADFGAYIRNQGFTLT